MIHSHLATDFADAKRQRVETVREAKRVRQYCKEIAEESRKRATNASLVLAIPCLTCGAAAGKRCEGVPGEPQLHPHRDRRLLGARSRRDTFLGTRLTATFVVEPNGQETESTQGIIGTRRAHFARRRGAPPRIPELCGTGGGDVPDRG